MTPNTRSPRWFISAHRSPLRRYVYGGAVFFMVLALLASSNQALVLAAGESARAGFQQLQGFLDPTPEAVSPLTDLAGPQPEVDVRPEEGPLARLQALGIDPVGKTEQGILPPNDIMDVARPPAGTVPLAVPAENPVPPNPFEAPAMWIDPETGKARTELVEVPTPTPNPVDVEPINVDPAPEPTSTPVNETVPPLPFVDIAGSDALADILYLTKRGLMDGTTPTTFAPEQALSHADAMIVLARAYTLINGSAAPEVETPFTDLQDLPRETLAAVGQAYGLGLIVPAKGDEKPLFNPDQFATRADAALWLARFYQALRGEMPPTETSFTDLETVDAETQTAIAGLEGLGVVSGCAGQVLAALLTRPYCPTLPITRATWATFVARLLRTL